MYERSRRSHIDGFSKTTSVFGNKADSILVSQSEPRRRRTRRSNSCMFFLIAVSCMTFIILIRIINPINRPVEKAVPLNRNLERPWSAQKKTSSSDSVIDANLSKFSIACDDRVSSNKSEGIWKNTRNHAAPSFQMNLHSLEVDTGISRDIATLGCFECKVLNTLLSFFKMPSYWTLEGILGFIHSVLHRWDERPMHSNHLSRIRIDSALPC